MCFHLGLLFRLKDHGLVRVCVSVQLAGFVKRDEGEENDQFTHLIANLPQGRESAEFRAAQCLPNYFPKPPPDSVCVCLRLQHLYPNSDPLFIFPCAHLLISITDAQTNTHSLMVYRAPPSA